MTLPFGKVALFVISHINTNLKIILTVVCLVSLLNRKVKMLVKTISKRVIVEINYCSLGIVFELKKGF